VTLLGSRSCLSMRSFALLRWIHVYWHDATMCMSTVSYRDWSLVNVTTD
jgi:hypothetical protein